MLKKHQLGNLNVRLKKGTVLPIDGINVQYSEGNNWSGDTHVLDTVDYEAFFYDLKDNNNNIIEIESIDTENPTATITEFKDNNEVVITTKEGEVINGYSLANGLISILGSDERHSKENDYEGSPLDLLVNADTLTKYFEVIE